jgi:hypothetical protein|tara:strand:- start:24 stop:239 length:216 start_codon:yes stop_codon:yes gene_type:complete
MLPTLVAEEEVQVLAVVKQAELVEPVAVVLVPLILNFMQLLDHQELVAVVVDVVVEVRLLNLLVKVVPVSL